MESKFLVCLGGNFNKEYPHPQEGEIYTFDGVDPFDSRFIYLKEFNIKAHCIDGYTRISYNSNRFRPVDDSFGEWVEATILQEGILEEAEKELTI